MKKRNGIGNRAQTVPGDLWRRVPPSQHEGKDPSNRDRNPSSFRHSPKTVNLGTMEADKDKEKTTDEKKPAEQVTKKREHKSGSSSVFSPILSVIA